VPQVGLDFGLFIDCQACKSLSVGQLYWSILSFWVSNSWIFVSVSWFSLKTKKTFFLYFSHATTTCSVMALLNDYS
jgi:hypothetical protein